MRLPGEATMHCCSGSDSDASRQFPAAAPAVPRRGKRGKRQCQVLGCTADLESDKRYCWKKRICSEHIAADAVTRKNRPPHLQWRYCFQCGKLELVTAFEGTHRSCRESLLRRKQGQGSKASGAANASQHQQQVLQLQPQAQEETSCCTALSKQHSDAASASLSGEAPLSAPTAIRPAVTRQNSQGQPQQAAPAAAAFAGSCGDLGACWPAGPVGVAGTAATSAADQQADAYYARVLDALLMQMAADGGPELCMPAAPSSTLEAAAAGGLGPCACGVLAGNSTGMEHAALQAEQLAQLIEDELRAACVPQPCGDDHAQMQSLSECISATPAAPASSAATSAQLSCQPPSTTAHSSYEAARPLPLAAEQLQLQGQLVADLVASVAAAGPRWQAGASAAGGLARPPAQGANAVVLHRQMAQLQEQLQELERLYVQVVAGLGLVQ